MSKFSTYACAAVFALSAPLAAQFTPGLDISISHMNNVATIAYDAAEQKCAVSASTTSCNVGSVVGEWFRPMDPRHPLICNMICREYQGRFEQLSNYCFVKHSFLSTNSNACGTCQSPGTGTLLGINCSDTYGAGLNADRFYLGPPEEIDPHTGEWKPIGSYFDRGFPDVGPPFNTDGQRSTITEASVLQNRCLVSDAEFAVSGARFYSQGAYIVQKEPEANRENNMASREISVTNSGNGFNVGAISSMTQGTVLTRWSGARLESAANYVGLDAMDGRFYVASKVTTASGGWYRYDYSVHNRDNHGGAAQFRVPLCPQARVRAIGFHDVDDDSQNDWVASVQGSELVFDAPPGNSHRWNSIYNVWFESDAAPADGDFEIVQANLKPGANPSVIVDQDVPGLLANVWMGPGCGPSSPNLYANGRGTLPAPGLQIIAEGAATGANMALHVGFVDATTALPGCTLYVNPILSLPASAGPTGVATWGFGLPNDPTAEGRSLYFQAIEAEPSGPLLNLADLSNGLRLRLGNNTNGCP